MLYVSGYFVGGTSPFGFRKAVAVYAEATIFDLDWIIINGGARGFFVKISPTLVLLLVLCLFSLGFQLNRFNLLRPSPSSQFSPNIATKPKDAKL